MKHKPNEATRRAFNRAIARLEKQGKLTAAPRLEPQPPYQGWNRCQVCGIHFCNTDPADTEKYWCGVCRAERQITAGLDAELAPSKLPSELTRRRVQKRSGKPYEAILFERVAKALESIAALSKRSVALSASMVKKLSGNSATVTPRTRDQAERASSIRKQLDLFTAAPVQCFANCTNDRYLAPCSVPTQTAEHHCTTAHPHSTPDQPLK